MASFGANENRALSACVAGSGRFANKNVGPVASTRNGHAAGGDVHSPVSASCAIASNSQSPSGSPSNVSWSHEVHGPPAPAGASRQRMRDERPSWETAKRADEPTCTLGGCAVISTCGPDDSMVNEREAGVGSARPFSSVPATSNV